jgi:putative IMPACT (imprinted ancient) family translation regulator
MEYLLSQNKIRRATHNILAYRIVRDISGRTTILQDYDDDGESGAGKKLMKLLELSKLENVMVVVSRWFGGILLGPDRFKDINNCARSLLVETKILPG